MTGTLRLYARGTSLRRGAEVRGWRTLEANLRYRQTGAWQVTGSAAGLVRRLAVSGGGLILVDPRGVPLHAPGGVLISGPVEDVGPTERTAAGDTAGPGALTVSGGDDLAVVAGELAWPDPTSPISDQTAAAYDARSGAAETVIKGYVGANVGTGRAVDRADPDVPDAPLVTIAADAARGGAVSYQARFDPLMDVVRSMCAASSPELGVRVTQVDDDRVFDVYQPVDRSSRVVFSFDRGNLRGYSLTRSAPTATHVVVAGAGEGSVRPFIERKDAAAAQEWRTVVRTFVDQRSTDVVAELEAAGDEALAQARRASVLSATAVDTASCRFGQHFGLGDWVAIELAQGVRYVDQVTAVKIAADKDGIHPTEVTIGQSEQDAHDSVLYQRVAALEAQLSALQRRH